MQKQRRIKEGLLIVLVLVLDQVTKTWIQNDTALHGHIEIIPDFFYLTYVLNTGAAWSMLAGHQVFLELLAAVVIGVLLYVLGSRKDLSALTRTGIALMIAGAAGNLLDRLLLGAVRDFLDFYIFGYDFPVFNVADMSLCIGVFLLILDSLIAEKREKKQNGTAQP